MRRKRREEYLIQREREDAERRRLEKERITQLYRNARYGDIIQVNISGGTINFSGIRRDYEPISFDLVRGERKQVSFHHQGKRISYSTNIWVAYHSNAFYFDVGRDPEYETRRDKIVILDDGRWDSGETYHPKSLGRNTGSQAQGITVFIRYKPMPGMQRDGYRYRSHQVK